MIPYAIRFGRAADLPYVTDSWVKSDQRFFGRRMSDATAHVRERIAHPDTRVRVAHLLDDEDAILGYAVLSASGEGTQVEFVYVRKDARGQGIAKALTA